MPIPIRRVIPKYPPKAVGAHIEGRVRLFAVLGTDGRLHEIQVISGDAMLVAAALDAVRQWRYAPKLLNGLPVEIEAPIEVNFVLAAAACGRWIDDERRSSVLRQAKMNQHDDSDLVRLRRAGAQSTR